MHLYLSGGGDIHQSKKLDDSFFNLLNAKHITKVIYIPLAISSGSILSSIQWFNDSYKNRIESIIAWKDPEKIRLELLNPNEVAVYIGGGNTYLLMDLLNRYNISKELKDFALLNGIIYGGSAGAIILGKDISIASDVNSIDLAQFKGLNLLEEYSIWPHYSSSDDKKITSYIHNTGNNVIALPEDAGIYTHNQQFEAIGYSPVYCFTNNKKKKLDRSK